MFYVLPYNCLFGYYNHGKKCTYTTSLIVGIITAYHTIRGRYILREHYTHCPGYIYYPYATFCDGSRVVRIYQRDRYTIIYNTACAANIATDLYQRNTGDYYGILEYLNDRFHVEFNERFETHDHITMGVKSL